MALRRGKGRLCQLRGAACVVLEQQENAVNKGGLMSPFIFLVKGLKQWKNASLTLTGTVYLAYG